MADINSSLPVRTQSNGDVVINVADGTVTTQLLGVDSAGKVTTKLNDGAGNAVTSQANGSQRSLDVGVNVAGVQVDPRAIRALVSTDVVTANQGSAAAITGAWPVQPTDGTNSQSYTAAREAKVSITQPIPAGTNLIGSVDIKDSSGASITLGQKVSASSLPVVIASDQSKIGVDLNDTSGNGITSQVSGAQRALDVGIDVAGVQVDPRQIRALTSSDVVTANVKDSSGNPLTNLNPLPVYIANSTPGVSVNKYNTSVNLAVGAVANHVYTITASKTFTGKKFWVSASGKVRADVQISPDGTTYTTYWTAFSSTSNPNISIDLDQLVIQDSGTGSTIRINITNEDKSAFDVFSTISGQEN